MDENYHSFDGPSGPIPAGGGFPPPPPVNAAIAPSGEQVPASQVAPQEFFSRSAGRSDLDSMQLKRLLRVFQRHWFLVLFLGFFLGGLMFTYNVILNKPYVPESIRIGPQELYASTVQIEQISKFSDIRVQLSGMTQQPIQMDMSNLGSIFSRELFRTMFLEELKTIRDAPGMDLDLALALNEYIESPGRDGMARLLPGSIFGGRVTVTIQGNARSILPPLGDAVVPALNRFGKRMRSQGIESALEKLTSTQTQNSASLSRAYMRLHEIQNAIQRKMPEKEIQDAHAAERAALQQSRAQLQMQIRRMENDLNRTKIRIDYETLSAQFGIESPEDISKVLIKGNPLRQEWQRLSSELDRLRLTRTDQHPDVLAVQQDILSVVRRMRETGATMPDGRIPRLPQPEEAENLESVQKLQVALSNLQTDLAFMEQRLAEIEVGRRPDERDVEVRETPEMMDLRVQLANVQAEISRLEDIQRNLTRQIGDLEVAKSHLEREIEFNALGRAGPPVYQEPRWLTNTFVALMMGLLLGYVIAYIAESSDTHLHTPSDVYYHLRLNYLGVVPRWSEREQVVIPAERPDSHIGEVYSHLCLNIRYGRSGAPEKRLLVASATQAEGKTTTAANIAIRYAIEGNKVLLVDADLRRPRLHKVLQLSGGASGQMLGLADYLAGGASLQEICYPTHVAGLSLAPAGSRVRNPAKLLTSGVLDAFFKATDEEFDIMVVDCPAVLPVVDATIIAPHMRGVLLVIAAEEVSIGAVRMAMYRMQHVGAPLIGALLNKVSERSTSYTYYGYRYRQGYYYSPYSKTYGETDDDDHALQ